MALKAGIFGSPHHLKSRCGRCGARNLADERSLKGRLCDWLSRNPVTERKIADLLERLQLQCLKTGENARLFDDAYYVAANWQEPQGWGMKAESVPQAANLRFVLTNLELPAQSLYDDFYVRRGADSEPKKPLVILF
jgi:hypothetical protein